MIRNIKKSNFLFKNVAIILALNEDQVRDIITCICSRDFSRDFPVTSLREKQLFLIQSNNFEAINCQDKLIIRIRYPIEFLLLKKLSEMNWKKTVGKVINAARCLNWNYSRSKQNIKLRLLNEVIDLDLYTTISTLGNLGEEFYFPKKLRNYRTNMIYYAVPMSVSRVSYNKIYFEYEFYKNVNYCDIHWVWTDDFAKSLARKSKNIIVKPVGPIMFKIREDTRIKRRVNQIVIFDVSPLKHVKKTTFYQMDLITKFFEDIIKVKNDLAKTNEFDIILKPKRAIGSSHLRSYRQMLNRFQNNADLKILDWNANPYALIAESVLTISIPFTSIALIGKEFDTKSIYYYPFPNQLYHPNSDLQVPIICGVINLRHFMQENFC